LEADRFFCIPASKPFFPMFFRRWDDPEFRINHRRWQKNSGVVVKGWKRGRLQEFGGGTRGACVLLNTPKRGGGRGVRSQSLENLRAAATALNLKSGRRDLRG
jgi:hypothetical protein